MKAMEPAEAVDLLENFATSGATWLLLSSTSYTQLASAGGASWEKQNSLNLQQTPFDLDKPLMVYSENNNSGGPCLPPVR